MKKEFRRDLHYFRAIAIIFIVAGHCAGTWDQPNFLGFIKTLTQGGTGLFVFISGFFFSYLYQDNFNYHQYLIKKCKYILMPYIILSSIFFLYYFVVRSFTPGYPQTNLFITFFYYLGFGKIYPSYWYIPFALVLFITTPVLIRFKLIKPLYQQICLFFLFLAAAFSHRLVDNTNVLQSFFYFLPFFLLGIYYDIHSEKIEKRLHILALPSLLLFLGIAALQVFIFQKVANYHKPFFEYNSIDLTIPSKLFLIVFLLYFTKKIRDTDFELLNIVGKTSFGIYFLHMFFLFQLNHIFQNDFSSISLNVIVLAVKTTTITSISVICILLVKHVLQGKSRFIIGY